MDMGGKHALAALIDEVRDLHGWSDQDLADHARARGYSVSKSNISRIRNNPVRSISEDQIGWLSASLGVASRRIVHAALTSMDLASGSIDVNPAEDAIMFDSGLPDDDRKVLLRMLQLMRQDGNARVGAAMTQQPTDHDATPTVPPGSPIPPGQSRRYYSARPNADGNMEMVEIELGHDPPTPPRPPADPDSESYRGFRNSDQDHSDGAVDTG